MNLRNRIPREERRAILEGHFGHRKLAWIQWVGIIGSWVLFASGGFASLYWNSTSSISRMWIGVATGLSATATLLAVGALELVVWRARRNGEASKPRSE